MTRGGHPVGGELDVGEPADAGGGDVGDRLANGHPARRRRIDQRQRRALAHRHRFAGITGEIHQRDRHVRHWNLPRSDHRVARAQAADRAIADRHQKRLVGHRRQLQHAVRGVADGDAGEVEGRQRPRTMRRLARHLRRLAEEHVERHVHRLVAEMPVGDDQLLRRRRTANDCERAALARADRAKAIEVASTDRQHIALLRFVAPDLARRHAGLLRGNAAQLEGAARAAAVHEFGQGVGQSAGPDVVQRKDRIRVAQLPAAVDHLLRAALHFGVAALYGIKIEIGGVGAGGHRRGGAAAHADEHAGAAQLNHQRAVG